MKSESNAPILLIFIFSVFIFTLKLLLRGITVRFRLCRNMISASVIFSLSTTCRISVKNANTIKKSPIVIPNSFDVVSDDLIKGAILRKQPPKKKNRTPQIDLSSILSLCFMSIWLLSNVIFRLTWSAISNMSLIVVNY